MNHKEAVEKGGFFLNLERKFKMCITTSLGVEFHYTFFVLSLASRVLLYVLLQLTIFKKLKVVKFNE